MITLLCVVLSFLSFTVGNDYPTTEKPLTCNINEVLNLCPGYCTFDETCEEVVQGLMRSCAPPPLDYECQPRCDCKSGLVRIDNLCEPVDKCCNGVNEEITDCPAPCDETCNGKPAADCQLSPCFRKGCRCRNGFVRDANRACIPRNQCIECKENEEFSTCGTCEASCDNLNPICTFDCKVGCFCKKGFVRDSTGNCIATKMCPQNQHCTGPNEEFSHYDCTNTCNPGDRCMPFCSPVCVCKKGFERKDGVCVEKNESIQCTGPNEEYKEIPFICTGQICPALASRWECVCKTGFERKDGVCVEKNESIQCNGPNEEFKKCPSCPPGRICPAVACRLECVCKEGFVRKNGICVKEIQPIKCNGPNEEFSSCVRVSCPPGKKCPAVCKPGCVCKNGFVRKNGVCVKNIVINPRPTPFPTKITIGPKPIEILPINPTYAPM